MTKLTEEELELIRQRVETERKQPFRTFATSQLIEGDVPALLEEVDRLRSELEGIVYLGHSMQPEHSAEDVLGCIIKSAREATYIEEDED